MDIELSSSAFRVDWDRVYPKAARYSLLATVLCLIQIALLFRQLHFTEVGFFHFFVIFSREFYS